MQVKHVRVEVWVSGNVQGVCFRESTRQAAKELGVLGWVENLADGRVHGILQGEATAVERLLAYMRVGPARAEVKDLQSKSLECCSDFDDFSVRRNQ